MQSPADNLCHKKEESNDVIKSYVKIKTDFSARTSYMQTSKMVWKEGTDSLQRKRSLNYFTAKLCYGCNDLALR